MSRNASLAALGVWLAAVALHQAAEAGTVGHWRFEEGTPGTAAGGNGTVFDSSANGLHGTPVKGPVYRSDVPGSSVPPSTRSLEFDGATGQRVQVGDGPLLALTHSMTLEAFIKARPIPPGTGGLGIILFRADNRPGLDPYLLATSGGGNVLRFQIGNAGNQVELITATIPYNQWLHVAGTLDDATGAMKLYVNGVVVASTTTSIRPLGALDPASSPGVSIGNDFTGQYGFVFNGHIDEVRISDAALAPGQFVPEPASMAMLVLGAAVISHARRGRPQQRA